MRLFGHNPVPSEHLMALLFAAVALLIGMASLLFVSNATLGVAGICFACLIAVLARMGQADDQHRRLMKMLGEWAPVLPPAAPPRPAAPRVTPDNLSDAAKHYGVSGR